MKDNFHYLKISISSLEKLERRYMSLDWDANIDRYVADTKKLKELFATVKTLKSRGEDPDRFYRDIQALLASGFCDKNEFNCFLNACDSTVATVKGNLEILKQVVDLYIEHRDFIELTPREWVQAIIDKGASRSLGSVGENKLVEIAVESGFTEVFGWDDFRKEDYAVVKFSKNNFDLERIKNELGIVLDFNSQEKMLDIVLKSRNEIVFLEAKHLKEGGGSQDKQIKELIGIIQSQNENFNVLYAAYLDGVYSNELIGKLQITDDEVQEPELNYGSNKLVSQRYDIIKALRFNKRSYWLNTTGFMEFARDFHDKS